MIPTPIPDELVKPGTERRVFAAPDGSLVDDAIRPCEALISRDEDTNLASIAVRLEFEPGEREAISAGAPVWLTMLGGLAPFAITVEGAEGPVAAAVESV